MTTKLLLIGVAIAVLAGSARSDGLAIGAYSMHRIEWTQGPTRTVDPARSHAWPSCGHPRPGTYAFRLEQDPAHRSQLRLRHVFSGAILKLVANGPSSVLVPPTAFAPMQHVTIQRLEASYAERVDATRVLSHRVTIDKAGDGAMRMLVRVLGTLDRVPYCEDSFAGPALPI